MNILFDLIAMQLGQGYGGAATYTQCVLSRLCSQIDKDIRLYGLYNSHKEFTSGYNISATIKAYNITLLDVNRCTISRYIEQFHIDTFFIPLAQFIAPYDVRNIHCRTIMMIHDIYDVEDNDSHLSLSLDDKNIITRKDYLKQQIKIYSNRYSLQVRQRYAEIIKLYNQSNVISGTVSEYSKYSIKYHFPEIKKEIRVWYSPAKKVMISSNVENSTLSYYLSNHSKYFLVVSANRKFKNAQIAIKAFHRFFIDHPDWHLLLINYPYSDDEHNIHTLQSLSDSDLEHAYKNAQALIFPSFYEGFGYPPIEALKYNVPSIASNVTSIPEIVADSAYLFSPMYTADLYRAICTFYDNHLKSEQKAQLTHVFQHISRRQDEDLDKLINCILNKETTKYDEN